MLYTPLWMIFAIEYCIKIAFSKNKIRYILNDPFGVLIILFPFLRPLTLLPLSRFGILIVAEQLRNRVPWIRKYRVFELLFLTIIIIVFSADLFLIFEKEPNTTFLTFGDAVWFTVSTISTAGFGDLYPRTLAGRVLATFLLIFGVSFFGAITAKIASLFIDTEMKKDLKIQAERMNYLSKEEKKVESLIEKVYAKEKVMENEIEELKNGK